MAKSQTKTPQHPTDSAEPMICGVTKFGLVVWLFLFLPACAHYQFGNRTLYRPDIRTIHVPIFTNSSFRRELGERVTEAVCKEIEANTPFKLASEESADSVLRGNLVGDRKLVQGLNGFDDPRIIQEDLQIEYKWYDQRGQLIRQPITLDLNPVIVEHNIWVNGQFYPEAGQSISTAQQKAIDDFAKQVVLQLQAPW